MTKLAIGIVAAMLAATCIAYVLWPDSRNATLTMFSWPSAEVDVDGSYRTEAPAHHTVHLPAGRHTLTFRPRSSGSAMAVQVKLRGGRHYYLRADLEARRYWLEARP